LQPGLVSVVELGGYGQAGGSVGWIGEMDGIGLEGGKLVMRGRHEVAIAYC